MLMASGVPAGNRHAHEGGGGFHVHGRAALAHSSSREARPGEMGHDHPESPALIPGGARHVHLHCPGFGVSLFCPADNLPERDHDDDEQILPVPLLPGGGSGPEFVSRPVLWGSPDLPGAPVLSQTRLFSSPLSDFRPVLLIPLSDGARHERTGVNLA